MFLLIQINLLMKKIFTLFAVTAVAVGANAANVAKSMPSEVVILNQSYEQTYDYAWGTVNLLDDGSYEALNVFNAPGGVDNMTFTIEDGALANFEGGGSWDTTYPTTPYWYYEYCAATDYSDAGLYLYPSLSEYRETEGSDTKCVVFTGYSYDETDWYDAGYVYIYIYWLDIHDPVSSEPVAEYTAQIWQYESEALYYANLYEYEDGTIKVVDFMGDGLSGDVWFMPDAEAGTLEVLNAWIVNLGDEEEPDYYKYLFVMDQENESWIGYWTLDGDYSWYVEDDPTYVEDPQEQYNKLAAFDVMDDVNYAYESVFILWDKVADGISAVAVEAEDAPVEYYNLSGVRVEHPTPGIYVVKQGGKVTKQVIR